MEKQQLGKSFPQDSIFKKEQEVKHDTLYMQPIVRQSYNAAMYFKELNNAVPYIKRTWNLSI